MNLICTDGVVVESALFQLPMWLMQALEESIHWFLISCNSTHDYVSWFFSFWYTLSEALITSTTSRCIFYTLSSANPFSRILLADDDFYTQDGCHVCLQTPIGHLVSAYSLISVFVLFRCSLEINCHKPMLLAKYDDAAQRFFLAPAIDIL